LYKLPALSHSSITNQMTSALRLPYDIRIFILFFVQILQIEL
jgi:hypothetical protein